MHRWRGGDFHPKESWWCLDRWWLTAVLIRKTTLCPESLSLALWARGAGRLWWGAPSALWGAEQPPWSPRTTCQWVLPIYDRDASPALQGPQLSDWQWLRLCSVHSYCKMVALFPVLYNLPCAIYFIHNSSSPLPALTSFLLPTGNKWLVPCVCGSAYFLHICSFVFILDST